MNNNPGEDAVIYEDKALNMKIVWFVLAVVLSAIALYWYFNIYQTDKIDIDETAIGIDLPSEVAVEPEAQSTDIVENFGFAEVSTTFVSPRSVADAVTYYMTAIVEKGGTVETTMRTPEHEIIVAKTADGKSYVIYIGEKDGETVVTINVDPV